MLNLTRSSDPSFHYVYPSSPNRYYLLMVDTDRILEELESCKMQLLDTPFSTSCGEYIYPVECDQIMDTSRDIREAVIRLAAKLGAIANLHGLPSGTYYKLNLYLHSAGGKSQKLDELLRKFRPICMQNSRQQRDTFARVQEAIRVCMQVCDQIQQETEEVLDTILMNTESFSGLPMDVLQKDQPGLQDPG